jgi:uncharacterized protein (TIGR02444 family)
MRPEEDGPAFNAGDEWRSVIATYARPGVAQACLLLQEALGVDVLVLLHLAYAQGRGHGPAGPEHVGRADAAIRGWRDTVVKPLRAVRRALGKDDPAVRGLRADIQRCELEAERHGLALLSAMPWPQGGASAPGAVQHVVRFYGERSGCLARASEPEVAAAIRLLENHLE